tara:strand:+ start:2445 stop:3188 length:744 start_codon:yes stop_codon:yes gene_type:complete
VQRRRKPKSEPRNIFDKSSGGRPPKNATKTRRETVSEAPPKPKTISPPRPVISKPPSSPKGTEKSESQPKETKTESPKQENTILEEQLLGVTKRQTRGLAESKEKEEKVDEANTTSSKAQQIIEASKARANAKVKVKETEPKPTVPTKKPTRPYRRNKPDFQPAIREKRLDRSRHMEYKYEMRGLLQDIDVAEEHRSALLGSIWAKGERQNTEESKQYILAKEKEGILSEEQVSGLLAIVEDYTIRR